MSLIVGYAASDIGFLVADTLLSYPTETYNPRKPVIEKFHALKIHILRPDIAVAFAGEKAAFKEGRERAAALFGSPGVCFQRRTFGFENVVRRVIGTHGNKCSDSDVQCDS